MCVLSLVLLQPASPPPPSSLSHLIAAASRRKPEHAEGSNCRGISPMMIRRLWCVCCYTGVPQGSPFDPTHSSYHIYFFLPSFIFFLLVLCCTSLSFVALKVSVKSWHSSNSWKWRPCLISCLAYSISFFFLFKFVSSHPLLAAFLFPSAYSLSFSFPFFLSIVFFLFLFFTFSFC